MRVTIKDIARALDLDHSTVSRALSGSDRVADATKERVRQMAESLGYRPDARARSLKTQCTRTIGVILPTCDEHDHAYLHHLIALVQGQLAAAGYDAIVAFDPLVDTGASHALRLATHQKVDGLLIAAYPDQLSATTLAVLDLPTVFFHVAPPLDGAQPVHARFITDNRAGGTMAADHLTALGHRKVGLVGLHRDRETSDEIWERQEGFAAYFQERGIDVTTFHLTGSSFEAGRQLATEIPPSLTGLFVISDIAAMGLIRGLQDRGIEIPRDLSIVGFDDLPGRELFSPLLTTLHQEREMMIRDATDHLLALLRGEKRAPITRTYPPDLILGETTARIATTAP